MHAPDVENGYSCQNLLSDIPGDRTEGPKVLSGEQRTFLNTVSMPSSRPPIQGVDPSVNP